LLGIDKLQSVLLDTLLEMAIEISSIEEDDFHASVPKLILAQIRWLDHVVDQERLSAKLLEALQISAVWFKRELLGILPGLVVEDHVFHALMDLRREDKTLVPAILEAFGGFSLSKDLTCDMINELLEDLLHPELELVPSYIKFLLHQANRNGQVAHVLDAIRQRLDLKKVGELIEMEFNAQQKYTGKGKARVKNPSVEVVLLLHAFKSQMQLHPTLVEHIISSISDSREKVKHLDVLLLVLLHDFNKKKVWSLFDECFINNTMDASLLGRVVSMHSTALKEWFHACINIAENLVRKSHHQAAHDMFCGMWKSWGDFERQEIIGVLITLIGSGLQGEMDCAFDILHTLKRHPSLGRFNIFIKNVLDYMENLSLQQVGKLFDVLATIALTPDDEKPGLFSELIIVIKKQIYSTKTKFKRMGVEAALAVASVCCTNAQFNEIANVNLQHKRLAEAVSLIECIGEHCRETSECLVAMLDGLATMVEGGNVHPRMQHWIEHQFACRFHPMFVIGPDHLKELQVSMAHDLGCETWFKGGDLSITIYPLVRGIAENVDEEGVFQVGQLVKDLPSIMAPLARLTIACGVQGRSWLDMPLVLFSRGHGNDVCPKEEKDTCLATLFYAVDWTRELLTLFSKDKDVDRDLIMAQLTRLHELEVGCENILSMGPTWQPGKTDVTVTALRQEVDSEADQEITGITKYKNSKTNAFKLSRMDQVRALLRDVDLSVHRLLSMDGVELSIKDVGFLLQDLLHKVRQKLNPRIRLASRASEYVGMTELELITFVVDVMPDICKYAELACEDVEEGNGELVHDKVYLTWFRLAQVVLDWHGFQQPQHGVLLSQFFAAFAQSTERYTKQPGQVSRLAFEYFVKYEKVCGESLEKTLELSRVLKLICKGAKDEELNLRLVGQFKLWLKKQWQSPDAIKNQSLDLWLSVVFEMDLVNLDLMNDFATMFLPECIKGAEGNLDLLEDCPLLNKHTLSVYYKALFRGLRKRLFDDMNEVGPAATLANVSLIVSAWTGMLSSCN
jgi:Fanconi anemia group D2 protein